VRAVPPLSSSSTIRMLTEATATDRNIGYVPAQYNSSMETYANNYRYCCAAQTRTKVCLRSIPSKVARPTVFCADVGWGLQAEHGGGVGRHDQEAAHHLLVRAPPRPPPHVGTMDLFGSFSFIADHVITRWGQQGHVLQPLQHGQQQLDQPAPER
jgi:hypothetical protein